MSENTYVFLIERIWVDSSENEIKSAVGYSPYGYVKSEKDANKLCETGRKFTSTDCWAIGYFGMPEYKYTKIKEIL